MICSPYVLSYLVFIQNHHSGLRYACLRWQKRLEGNGWSTDAHICNFFHRRDCPTDSLLCILALYTWKTGHKLQGCSSGGAIESCKPSSHLNCGSNASECVMGLSNSSIMQWVRIEREVAIWRRPKAISVFIKQCRDRMKLIISFSVLACKQSRHNHHILLSTSQEICNCVSHLLT